MMTWLYDYAWPSLAKEAANGCERCGERGLISTDDHKLCGCVTARLCKLCLRKWEIDAKVRELSADKNLANVRINAAIQGGNANIAEGEYTLYEKAENAFFEFAMEWLRVGNERPVVVEEDDDETGAMKSTRDVLMNGAKNGVKKP